MNQSVIDLRQTDCHLVDGENDGEYEEDFLHVRLWDDNSDDYVILFSIGESLRRWSDLEDENFTVTSEGKLPERNEEPT